MTKMPPPLTEDQVQHIVDAYYKDVEGDEDLAKRVKASADSWGKGCNVDPDDVIQSMAVGDRIIDALSKAILGAVIYAESEEGSAKYVNENMRMMLGIKSCLNAAAQRALVTYKTLNTNDTVPNRIRMVAQMIEMFNDSLNIQLQVEVDDIGLLANLSQPLNDLPET